MIGAVAGWIAEKLTRSDMGLFMNIIVGIIGAYIGGFLANAAGIQLGEFFQAGSGAICWSPLSVRSF